MSRTKHLHLLIPKDAVQIIGIDPGTNTGVAVWDRSKNMFTKLVTKDIDEAWDIIREYYAKDRSFIIIEDPNLRNDFKRMSDRNRLQGAGSIKRDFSIWEKRFNTAGFEYVTIGPQHFQSYDNHEVFLKVINQHFSRTSIHSRDAAMMVYRR